MFAIYYHDLPRTWAGSLDALAAMAGLPVWPEAHDNILGRTNVYTEHEGQRLLVGYFLYMGG